MTWALPFILLMMSAWFVLAIATIAAWNIAKAAVLRRRSKVSLAALYAEAGITR